MSYPFANPQTSTWPRLASGVDSSESLAVLAALEEQVGCYRSLAKLAGRQHEYVQNDQTEQLLEVLREREGVLDRLAALEKAVGPARRDWANFAGGLSPGQRQRGEAMMSEARALLAEITEGDERDALALQQRKHRVGSEIRATASSAAVNRSYAASAYGRPRVGGIDQRT